MKFSIKAFFSKCDQVRSFLRIWSHLLKKSFMKNFIFWVVYVSKSGLPVRRGFFWYYPYILRANIFANYLLGIFLCNNFDIFSPWIWQCYCLQFTELAESWASFFRIASYTLGKRNTTISPFDAASTGLSLDYSIIHGAITFSN